MDTRRKIIDPTAELDDKISAKILANNPPAGVDKKTVGFVVSTMLYSVADQSDPSKEMHQPIQRQYRELILALLNAGWTVVDKEGRMVHQDDDTNTAMTVQAALLCSIAVAGGQ